ncbi:hypothetical protein, partial [Staphylococcus felis]|uniref:hypothetical protein n=3 Tax=Staphylococcus felis TaxID=46127 RepID=UPI0019D42911
MKDESNVRPKNLGHIPKYSVEMIESHLYAFPLSIIRIVWLAFPRGWVEPWSRRSSYSLRRLVNNTALYTCHFTLKYFKKDTFASLNESSHYKKTSRYLCP